MSRVSYSSVDSLLVVFMRNFIKLRQHSPIIEDSRSIETEVGVDLYEEVRRSRL